MKKLKFAMLASLLMLATASCTKPIPDGPVKDFIQTFNYDEAFKSVEYATSAITSVSFKNGKQDGKATTLTQIHKNGNEYYQYMDIEVNGSYHGKGDKQFDYNHQEVLTYGDINKGVKVSEELTDGTLKHLEYSNTDLITSVNNFFYKELKSGFHHGGMYYADYVLANVARFNDKFTVSDDKNTLTFKLDAVSKYEDQLVINRHTYTVDKLGLALYVKIRSELYDDLTTYTETECICSYNEEFIKIQNLKKDNMEE